MTSLLTQKIDSPCAWRGEDLVKDPEQAWIYHLSPDTLAVLDRAMVQVRDRGLKAPNFIREDFLIPELDKEIQNLANELENGRGFLLLRGLPAELYSEEEMAIIYYGLGLIPAQGVEDPSASCTNAPPTGNALPGPACFRRVFSATKSETNSTSQQKELCI